MRNNDDAAQTACIALVQYTAAAAGLPIEGETEDPEGIAVSALVGIALGNDFERQPEDSPAGSPWAASAFDGDHRMPPAYGTHEHWWLAEAEVFVRLTVSKSGFPRRDSVCQGRRRRRFCAA